MQDEHRKAIQKIYSSLVEQTDLDWMVSALFEKSIFSERMIEPYKNTNIPVRDRKQQLYMDITRRGPRAFDALLEALTEAGHWQLVRDLDPGSPLNLPAAPLHRRNDTFISPFKYKAKASPDQQNNNKSAESRQTPSTSPKPATAGAVSAPSAEEELSFEVIKSTKFYDDTGEACYRTRGRQRGVLLVFSFVQFAFELESERHGADLDCRNLKYLFDQLGFKVLVYRDLTEQETRATLEQSRSVVQGADCVFLVVSSHGHARYRSSDVDIRCHDGKLISFSDIIDYFNNKNSPHLVGVPKVFIFQVCRGEKWDYAWLPHKDDDPDKDNSIVDDSSFAARDGERKEMREAELEESAGEGRVGSEGTAELAMDGATTYQDTTPPQTSPSHSRHRIYSDILIAHSTVPGYVSHRVPESGSLYIQALCAVFAAHAHDTHVQRLFRLVDRRLQRSHARAPQTSSVDYWGFNQLLYLHPGLHD